MIRIAFGAFRPFFRGKLAVSFRECTSWDQQPYANLDLLTMKNQLDVGKYLYIIPIDPMGMCYKGCSPRCKKLGMFDASKPYINHPSLSRWVQLWWYINSCIQQWIHVSNGQLLPQYVKNPLLALRSFFFQHVPPRLRWISRWFTYIEITISWGWNPYTPEN